MMAGAQSAVFPPKDVAIVRGLAGEVMEFALSDECEARRRRWRDANDRRGEERAPVWCRPAAVWAEILPQDSLACSDPHCRRVEYALRQHLHKLWIGDDHIVAPWWGVGAAFTCSTQYTWGLPTHRSLGTTERGGFSYYHPVETPEDYERVTVPEFAYNREATERSASVMQDLLGDSMPVRVTGQPPLGPHLSVYLEQLRGMMPMMEDLALRPELVHRTMAKLTEGVLRAQRVAEDAGVLTTNHHEPMTCSDPLGDAPEGPVGPSPGTGEAAAHEDVRPPASSSQAARVEGERPGEPGDQTRPERGAVKLCNLWAAANSQEFDEVSPAMHEEFLLSYQKVLLQQYGAAQYGCCEDLSTKVDIVLGIPNLRVFVCSFWTDLDKVAEGCGDACTIMWRQSSAQVTLTSDLSEHRQHLEAGMRRLRGLHYQVVLRELQTLDGRPERLRDWARLTIELAEEYAG